jgi:hypothetical protein
VQNPPNKQPKSSWIWSRDQSEGRIQQIALPSLLRGAIAKLGRVLAMRTYEPPNLSPIRCHGFEKSGGKHALKRSRDGGHPDGDVAVMMIKRQRRTQEEAFDREGWKRIFLE